MFSIEEQIDSAGHLTTMWEFNVTDIINELSHL